MKITEQQINGSCTNIKKKEIKNESNQTLSDLPFIEIDEEMSETLKQKKIEKKLSDPRNKTEK